MKLLIVICIAVEYVDVNGTATTEIYTDGHTISLLDALPIAVLNTPRKYSLGLSATPEREEDEADASGGENAALDGIGPIVYELSRSEEHTSELQSLMRISYAVFRLKKNKFDQCHQPVSSTIVSANSKLKLTVHYYIHN